MSQIPPKVARSVSRWLLVFCVAVYSHLALSQGSFDYQLHAIEVAPNTFVVPGTTEDFSLSNGGNIVNIGFVVTTEGVVLIDTGPSLRYAQQLSQLIAEYTNQPVIAAINTHHHPDHWFGNQFFKDIPIYALPQTISAMNIEGDNFADNLYRMSGDWMRSTTPLPATRALVESHLSFGNHTLELIPLRGHTIADLAIFDRATGVLFAGDLVFDQRAPTTPHASITDWIGALNTLGDVNFSQLVPGHGPVADDDRGIDFTRHYLTWLDDLLVQGARSGTNPTELMQTPIPAAFSDASLVHEELARSVVHLYGRYEYGTLKSIKEGGYN